MKTLIFIIMITFTLNDIRLCCLVKAHRAIVATIKDCTNYDSKYGHGTQRAE